MLLLVAVIVSSVTAVPLKISESSAGYGKRSAQNNDYVDYDGADQVAVASVAATGQTESRVSTSAIARALAAANAKPQEIVRQEGYGKRSAQNNDYVDYDGADQIAVASVSAPGQTQSRVPLDAIAKALAAANAKPQEIVRQEGYGKRSAQSNDYDYDGTDQVTVASVSAAGQTQSRVPSDAIAKALAAANAKPQEIVRQEGYGKRSVSGYGKRSPQEETTEASADAPVTPHPAADKVSADIIANILKIAGAKPSPIDEADRSYAGKRSVNDEVFEYGKRSAESENAVEGLVTVPLSAVKVKPHSSNGNIAQHFDGDATYQSSVHASRFGRSRRSGDFIPFHVYDERRVKTLKVEQNDFLSLSNKNDARNKANKKSHA